MPGNIADLITILRGGGEHWLLLFDIDGTLVDTGGKGMSALKKTAIEVFGGDGPQLDLAGSTDLGILENLYVHFGVDPTDEQTHSFFCSNHDDGKCSRRKPATPATGLLSTARHL
jgi:phosphoglycolate phosphatase-like HAD superfamily hydrolase